MTVTPSIANRVIGVIDLLDGHAVHAVAGNRQQYRGVSFCDGDPERLAMHYLRLGLSRLYVADLDALEGRAMQIASLASLASMGFTEIVLDIGWTGRENSATRQRLARFSRDYPSASWIAASESCRNVNAIADAVDCMRPGRVLLGLDYRNSSLLAAVHAESAWVEAAAVAGCDGAVVLDVGAVGTASGPVTADICRRLRDSVPAWKLYSGGGVRHLADAQLLYDAGCQAILLATALFPQTP